MYDRRFKGDPRWITARYAGKCAKCGAAIRRGARAFYYPNGRGLFCDSDGCGRAAERDFLSCAASEAGQAF